MKKLICMLLALALILLGCAPAGGSVEPTQPSEEQGQSLEFQETDPPEGTLHVTQPHDPAPQTVGDTGKARIDYTGDVSAVYYITAWEMLPDYEALRGAVSPEFFEDHALVVVFETVSSGSVELSIDSIDEGVVTLGRTMTGNTGTMDMATWILWTEVEQGLDYEWSVANSGVRSNVSKY